MQREQQRFDKEAFLESRRSAADVVGILRNKLGRDGDVEGEDSVWCEVDTTVLELSLAEAISNACSHMDRRAMRSIPTRSNCGPHVCLAAGSPLPLATPDI